MSPWLRFQLNNKISRDEIDEAGSKHNLGGVVIGCRPQIPSIYGTWLNLVNSERDLNRWPIGRQHRSSIILAPFFPLFLYYSSTNNTFHGTEKGPNKVCSMTYRSNYPFFVHSATDPPKQKTRYFVVSVHVLFPIYIDSIQCRGVSI